MKVNFAFHLEIKVTDSGGRVERHRIHVAWSPMRSFHSQWWFGLPCHLLVWVHCVFWSQRSHLPENFRALHASFCWQTLWRCWHFPAGFGTCPQCQWYQKLVHWPWCYCAWLASKLTIENLWGIVKRKMRDTSPNNADDRYQSNLGFYYTWAVLQADCLHATPHWCSNSCKKRLNQVLGAYKRTYFSEAWHFYLKYAFLLILCNIPIFWDTEFWVFIICKICVMNLYNIWVSLSEMSDKKYWLFMRLFFFRCICISWMAWGE